MVFYFVSLCVRVVFWLVLLVVPGLFVVCLFGCLCVCPCACLVVCVLVFRVGVLDCGSVCLAFAV